MTIIERIRRFVKPVEEVDPVAKIDSAVAELKVLFIQNPAYHAAYMQKWGSNSPLSLIFDKRLLKR